jgi:D-psicose/D-tagatose/L-ribulose 3-epimerase
MRTLGIEVFYWLDRWDDDQKSVFERVRKTGYNAAEISLVSGPDIDINHYKNVAAANDLQIYCSMGLPADKDITSSDDQMRQAGIDYLKRCVQTAAALGSPALGGLPYVPWLYFPDDNNLQPYRDRAAAAVREVAAVAADEGIVICLEIINRFETFMFNTVQEGLAFLRKVDHPAVKLHLDTYHMNMEEDHMGDAIRAASEHLGHFSLCGEQSQTSR